MKVTGIVIRQLISKSFLALIALSLIVAPLSFHVTAFFITMGLMMAAVTSVHELSHIRKAEELGYPVSKLEVLGLGNVRYEVKAPPEVMREVARAPYFNPAPYLTEIAFLLLLTAIALSAGPYNVLLLTLELVPLIHMVSTICAHLTFKGYSCEKLAKLASPEDLKEGL